MPKTVHIWYSRDEGRAFIWATLDGTMTGMVLIQTSIVTWGILTRPKKNNEKRTKPGKRALDIYINKGDLKY